MKYLKVQWLHNNSDDPIWLYSELDDERWEIRKIEVFRNGTKGYASATEKSGDTRLSIETVPPIEEIASQPEFMPSEISREEFEDAWLKRRARAK